MNEFNIHDLQDLFHFCGHVNRMGKCLNPSDFKYRADLMADLDITEDALKRFKSEPLLVKDYYDKPDKAREEMFLVFSHQDLCVSNFDDCVFDGNGHTIRTDRYIPFRFNSGTIKNLIMTGSISPASSTGMICGTNKGVITGCRNEAVIHGPEYHACSGICHSNTQTGVISGCENRGEIHVPSRISFIGAKTQNYRYSQICYENYGTLENNREHGRVRFPYDDSLTGIFLRSSYIRDSFLRNLLKQDLNTTHLNKRGENYLHILCQNRAVSDDSLAASIVVLATETDINFEAIDKRFRKPASYLKKGYRKSKETIEYIIHERQVEKMAGLFDSDFSTIGF